MSYGARSGCWGTEMGPPRSRPGCVQRSRCLLPRSECQKVPAGCDAWSLYSSGGWPCSRHTGEPPSSPCLSRPRAPAPTAASEAPPQLHCPAGPGWQGHTDKRASLNPGLGEVCEPNHATYITVWASVSLPVQLQMVGAPLHRGVIRLTELPHTQYLKWCLEGY